MSENGQPPFYKIQVQCRFLFWRYWADSPDPDLDDIDRWLLDGQDAPAKRFHTFLEARTFMEKCAFPETLKYVELEEIVALYEH